MTFLMLVVLSISIAITAMKFGAAALQDNFVAEISTNYENSIEFVAFYGLLNFYMYTMAFVYSPSKNAQYGKGKADHSFLSCCIKFLRIRLVLKTNFYSPLRNFCEVCESLIIANIFSRQTSRCSIVVVTIWV